MFFFIFRFQDLDNDIVYPPNDTHEPCRYPTQARRCRCEPLLAGRQWACFWTVTTTADAWTLRCRCEPLLAGWQWALSRTMTTTAADATSHSTTTPSASHCS